MRAFAIAVSLLAFSHYVCGAESPDTSQLAANARALESRSRESLGISLRQLSLLLQANPREFFDKQRLVKNGSWALLKELESSGFVSISESPTLPDGQQMGSSVISFSTTAKGQAVVGALQGT